MVIYIERGRNDFHMVQLRPVTVPPSCALLNSRTVYLPSRCQIIVEAK